MEKKKQQDKKNKKKLKFDVKKSGLDIDKAEYQDIILSNSNDPARSFYNNY